ncbi:MAG TPA: ABC transporter permease, partial [Ferruginibacter sp.]|nr:ABC transporter permease [Ferruginibacter sp.]
MQKYSQVRAMLAITKASLRAIFRSPSAVVFSFAFPFVFILVFGFIGNSGTAPTYRIVLARDCDTANAFYDAVKKSNRIRIVSFDTEEELRSNIVKGRIAGVLSIRKSPQANPEYTYSIKSSNASNDKWPQLLPILEAISNKISNQKYENRQTFAVLDFDDKRDIEIVREYRTIDFILPGQLGFSLLSSGV